MKGPNESAGEEAIDLNKASPGAGGYKALGTNARRKKQAGSVSERTCIKGKTRRGDENRARFIEEHRWRLRK